MSETDIEARTESVVINACVCGAHIDDCKSCKAAEEANNRLLELERSRADANADFISAQAETIKSMREALEINRSICRDTVRGWMNRLGDVEHHANEALKKIGANCDAALSGKQQ